MPPILSRQVGRRRTKKKTSLSGGLVLALTRGKIFKTVVQFTFKNALALLAARVTPFLTGSAVQPCLGEMWAGHMSFFRHFNVRPLELWQTLAVISRSLTDCYPVSNYNIVDNVNVNIMVK